MYIIIYIYIYIHVCAYVYIYIYMYVCMYTYVYMYTYADVYAYADLVLSTCSLQVYFPSSRCCVTAPGRLQSILPCCRDGHRVLCRDYLMGSARVIQRRFG